MSERYENPVRTGFDLGKSPGPVSIVIFGATGDLTSRKLVPAFYSLLQEGHLPAKFSIVGYARRDWSDDFFREQMKEGVKRFSRFAPDDTKSWNSFAESLSFVKGDFDNPEGFKRLDNVLTALAAEKGMPDNRLYYLSAPPSAYESIVINLGKAGMASDQENGWRRIVIEKPFGSTLASAQALNSIVHSVFREAQVYRIDHYLGKETVQNIMVLRFANAIFEPLWNRSYIDNVQISVAESVGVGGRAGYYDHSGVVRDMFQNHIMQVLTLVAMEAPVAFEADAIRDEKVKVLRAVRPMRKSDLAERTVRAQYGPGVVDGEPVKGYLEETDVPANSETATYAAMEWYVDNWRWQGVPFYVRSGKRLATRATEIAITFKRPPHLLFDSMDDEKLRHNVLAIRVQPDEGISMRFEAKVPGQGIVRRSVTMDFSYGESFDITAPPEAYERLLLDAILGDATLFARSDEIEWAWTLIDPVIEGWANGYGPTLRTYEAGTWGPMEADSLVELDGHTWRTL